MWINETEITAFPTSTFNDPGTKVFSSKNRETDSVRITEGSEGYTIPFDTPFEWHEGKNIIVTVFDSTGVRAGFTTTHYMMKTEGVARYLHQRTLETDFANSSWNMNNLTKQEAVYSGDRGYVNKITFVFAPAPETAPATPNDLAVSSVTANSATLAWSAVEGATSYDLQQSANGSDWSELASDITATSYTWSELSAQSTQYVRICAVNTNGSSGWSDAVTVTTDAIHSHNGIEFDKWTNTSAMPTSGNYYLNNDVTLDPYDPQTITLTGNLNLCLNGNTANLYGTKIVVPSGKTLTIYDNVGGGKLTGFVASEAGMETYSSALIVVQGGGTLVLKEGTIENTYIPDETGSSYAIYSNGTINLSGDVNIISETADIYLYSTNVITISGALSNAEKHSVYRANGTFTSGWSTYMSGENPADFFSATDASHAVVLEGSEAKLVNSISLSQDDSEEDFSDKIEGKTGIALNVSLTRSLTSAQYNTFCLPFALTDEQMQEVFGEGYDLEELTSSSLDGDLLNMEFTPRTDLEAGKPYLLQPAVDVENPTFEGVTITATSPGTSTTDYIDFKAIYSPTWLTDGDESLLFLGADNTLFSPAGSTDPMKGFRGYFKTKNGVKANAIRAHITKKTGSTTGIGDLKTDGQQRTKVLRNGQLLIIRGENTYNAQGQLIK